MWVQACRLHQEKSNSMRHIVITISEIYLDRLSSVVESLRKEGVVVTHLYKFGVIIGIADDSVIPRIRNRKEVISLNEEREATIPPPDADVQLLAEE